MKTYLKILLSCLLLLVLIFMPSCGETQATDFSSEPINNVQNNLKAGGRLAYTEGKIYYVNIVNDIVYSGLYTLDVDGTTAIEVNTDTGLQSFLDMPCIYNFDNNLYKFTQDDDALYVYNSEKNQFEISNLNEGVNSYNYHIENDLLVYAEVGKNRKVKIKYKDNKTYTLPDKIDVDAFCVQDEKIYYINSYQSLKVHDPAKGEDSIEKIDNLYRYDGYSPIIICGDYLYFAYEDGEYKNGLYRYSLSNKKIELALENNSILCLNTNGESVFVATEKTVSMQLMKIVAKKSLTKMLNKSMCLIWIGCIYMTQPEWYTELTQTEVQRKQSQTTLNKVMII